MKNLLYAFLAILLFSGIVSGQSPDSFKYQAVARDASGNEIVNTMIEMRISILQGSANGIVVCEEVFVSTTNAFGLVNLEIGSVNPTAFCAIDWNAGPYFVKVELDPQGGSNYIVTGTSQLLSVPYALYAKNTGSHGNTPGDMQYWNGSQWVILPAGMANQTLIFCNGAPHWGPCPGALPTLTTNSVGLITSTSAITGGNITDGGESAVTERGVCWSIHQTPTITDNKTSDGTGTGRFTSNLSGLAVNTTYYVRSYATNGLGTAYGQEESFTTLQGGPVLDYDGNLYSIVSIGNQEWLGENLKTTHYNNGDEIPYVPDGTEWSTTTTNAYCNYNNDESNAATYGRIYNWYVAGDSRKACPSGWHVPGADEFTTLVTYLGGETVAGGKLKSTGTIEQGDGLWLSPNTGATNESGFSGFPGGFRDCSDGTYYSMGEYGNWWSSTEEDSDYAWGRLLMYSDASIVQGTREKWGGVSIRCIRDAKPILSTANVSEITSSTAVCGGNITSDGGSSVTGRGVCYGTSPNPTIFGNHTSDGNGTGEFVSNIMGLLPNTMYYIKAYATNSSGTAYGDEQIFTTIAGSATIPTLVTTAVTNITAYAATSGGNITSDGGSSVTGRGVCWSTSSNPTLSDNHTTDGNGTGVFASGITGLSANTQYYVRAYATNSIGTAYGNELTFTTSAGFPILTTNDITNLASITATCGGNITNSCGADVTARGVCWNTSVNPTISDSHTTDGSGIGQFISNLTGLIPNTVYYVRAYATNSVGTAYGNTKILTTYQTNNTVIDYDGNIYHIVTIGTQQWLVENLKVTHYNNGDAIPEVTDNDQWSNLSTGAYCNYGNNQANATDYGRLYNWFAVNDSRKICPSGWHVASSDEWNTLANFLGGEDVAGGKLKAPGTIEEDNGFWLSPNNGATNESGFSAFGGGQRIFSGEYNVQGTHGIYWSSSQSGSMAWIRYIFNTSTLISTFRDEHEYGHSVRCIKD